MTNYKSPKNLTFKVEDSAVVPVDNQEEIYIKEEQGTALETEKIKSRRQDRKERKRYAQRIFVFISVWCAGIFVLIVLNGFGCLKFETSVLITLITTTTANILTLFLLVTKYLFHRTTK